MGHLLFDKATCLKVDNGLFDLLAGVYYERAGTGEGLPEGLSPNEQEAKPGFGLLGVDQNLSFVRPEEDSFVRLCGNALLAKLSTALDHVGEDFEIGRYGEGGRSPGLQPNIEVKYRR